MIRKAIFVLAFLFAAVSVRASDIYITQSGTGGGTSCANPLSAAFFNNAANWGTGQGQIGPGTTVHLCGTFTGAAGATMLTAHGSGTSTSPITILFEAGAKFTAPYWSSLGGIVLNGLSWIVVNGDINNGRQGIMQNTDNGSNKTYQQQTRTIYANGCSNCTIKNLTFADLYDKLPDVAITSITGNGTTATVTCASACNNKINHKVAVEGNSLGGFNTPGTGTITIASTPDSTHFTFSSTTSGTGTGGVVTDNGVVWSAVTAIYGGHNVSPNFTIDNVLAHDLGWALDNWAQNYTVSNSEVYNADHGIVFGANVNVGGLDIHGNHFHDFAAWDTANDTFHHDYIHLWDLQAGTSITDGVIYNNKFDGVLGNCCTTAHLYLEGSIGGTAPGNGISIFNNTFIESGAQGRYGIEMWGDDTPTSHKSQANTRIYNNFFSMGGQQQGAAIYSAGQVVSNLTVENNIVIGSDADISLINSTTITAVDYDLYDDLFTDYGDTHTFNFNGTDTHDFATWKSACNCDSHGQIATKAVINVNSSGVPQTGSPAIGTGVNLTSIATGTLAPLAKDITGKQRPSTGAWDIGAFQQGAGGGQPINKVQVVPHSYANNTTLSVTLTETAGNFLVATTTYVTNVTASVSDTLGNTWHAIPAQTNGNSGCGTGSNNNFSGAQLWYAENIKAGSNTVTLTLSGISFLWLEVVEYSGVKTSGSLLANIGSSSTTAVSSISTGNLNASGPNNLIVAAITDTDQARASMTAGTGYTLEGIYGGNGSMFEDLISVPAGTYNPSATYNNGADACGAALGAAFSSQ